MAFFTCDINPGSMKSISITIFKSFDERIGHSFCNLCVHLLMELIIFFVSNTRSIGQQQVFYTFYCLTSSHHGQVK